MSLCFDTPNQNPSEQSSFKHQHISNEARPLDNTIPSQQLDHSKTQRSQGWLLINSVYLCENTSASSGL